MTSSSANQNDILDLHGLPPLAGNLWHPPSPMIMSPADCLTLTTQQSSFSTDHCTNLNCGSAVLLFHQPFVICAFQGAQSTPPLSYLSIIKHFYYSLCFIVVIIVFTFNWNFYICMFVSYISIFIFCCAPPSKGTSASYNRCKLVVTEHVCSNPRGANVVFTNNWLIYRKTSKRV